MIIPLSVLTILLQGCSTVSYRTVKQAQMPHIPIAGKMIGKELNEVCAGKDKLNKCPYLTAWLNRMMLFEEEYQILNGARNN